MSCGRYAEDFDSPIGHQNGPPHDVFAGACLDQKIGTKLGRWRADTWHVLRALRFGFSAFGSLGYLG